MLGLLLLLRQVQRAQRLGGRYALAASQSRRQLQDQLLYTCILVEEGKLTRGGSPKRLDLPRLSVLYAALLTTASACLYTGLS